MNKARPHRRCMEVVRREEDARGRVRRSQVIHCGNLKMEQSKEVVVQVITVQTALHKCNSHRQD